MNILITNDDGICAKGINMLAKALCKYHKVFMVAPMEQRSASSHAITIRDTIRIKKVEKDYDCIAYSISGTPADCVKIALDKLIKEKIDFIISGINLGLNVGEDILYSGTVSAAIEGAIYKIPSIAVSTEFITKEDGTTKDNFELAVKYALDLLKKCKGNNAKNDVVLNLNIPLCNEDEIKGIKVCKIGSRIYTSRFEEHIDKNGDIIITPIGERVEQEEKDTDSYYIRNNYVTLTPLHYDLTNFNILEQTQTLINN